MKVLKSYECMNACILNHMNRAGMEINGSDIFFSGGGYPVSYKKGSLTHIVSDGYETNSQVKRSIKCYLDGTDHFWLSRSTGEKAISCMVKEMGKYVEKKDFRDITIDANLRLRVDGYMGAKKFLLEKLWEQGKTKLAEEYKILIDRWSKWCMLLLKSGLVATPENFSFVKQRMEELVQQEHHILEKY